jgi:PAS domain S-box-containing protein
MLRDGDVEIRPRLAFLAEVALVAAGTGWVAALYGALYIYATADFTSTGSFWVFGWPFLLALLLATATNLFLAGAGRQLLPSPLGWVNAINRLMAVEGSPENAPVEDLPQALVRLPLFPTVNCLFAMGLASLVTAAMVGLEWMVAGTTRNVGPVLFGGTIATLTYGATNFAVSDLLVGRRCARLRLAGVRRGLDPYAGPTIHTWVRVVTLAAPTVLALMIASRLAADAHGSWVALLTIVVAGSMLLAALAWLQTLTIRTAAEDLGAAASRLTRGEEALFVTGSTDAHLVAMARAFNRAATEVDRSLRMSAARYSALFEGAGDAILLVDAATGCVLEANRRAHELTGLDADEMRRTRIDALFAPPFAPLDLAAEAKGESAGGRFVVRPDGTRSPVDVALSTVALGDQTVLQAILHDVSGRQRIENDLRESLQRLEGLYHLAVTLGGTVEQVAEHIATTLAELLDFPVVIVARHVQGEAIALATYDGGALTRGLRVVLAGTPCGRVHEERQPCVFHDVATSFPHDDFLAARGLRTYVGVPALGADRSVVGCVSALDPHPRVPKQTDMRLLSAFAQRLARAIAEEDQAREREALVLQLTVQNAELRAAQERLTEADRLKSEFMGMMSHELRTPLNVFVGYTEMLLDAARENGARSVAEHREVLERMLDAAGNLTNLVEDTLSVLRLEGAGVRVNREELSLQLLFAELQAAGRFLRAPAAVFEHWVVEADLPIIVSDRMKLRQILTNLVGNARKFTSSGSITVSAARAGAAAVAIAVEDTGCGIAEDDLPFVFDLYRQAGNNGASHNGCGIGLYIVHRYCQVLGGHVDLQSEVGKGTRITITLPGCEAQDSAFCPATRARA